MHSQRVAELLISYLDEHRHLYSQHPDFKSYLKLLKKPGVSFQKILVINQNITRFCREKLFKTPHFNEHLAFLDGLSQLINCEQAGKEGDIRLVQDCLKRLRQIIKSAVSVQSIFRGVMVRRVLFSPDTKTPSDYKVIPSGNDPLNMDEIALRAQSEGFVLVATGGLRCIEVAMALSRESIVPTIILIDNSKHVAEFWQLLKIAMNKFTHSEAVLRGKEFRKFLAKQNYQATQFYQLMQQIVGTEAPWHGRGSMQEPSAGFLRLRHFINSVKVYCQDWQDIAVFKKVKLVAGESPIIVYPSNIVAFIEEHQARQQVLDNIHSLSPHCVIHTNLEGEAGSRKPTKMEILEDSTPARALEALSLSDPEHGADKPSPS